MSEGFAERLRTSRSQMTLQDLANRAGVSERSLFGWEKGERLPRPKQIQALAVALGVNAEWLETGEGEAHPGRNKPSSSGYVIEYDDELGIRGSLNSWLGNEEKMLLMQPTEEEIQWLRTRIFRLGMPPSDRLWEVLLAEYRKYKREHP